jgi:hypothetical protein
MIEGDDAMDLGAGQVEPGCDLRDRRRRDVPQFVLDSMQDDEQWPRLMTVTL